MRYQITTRIKEGANWEDIENGDGEEVVYLIFNDEGELVRETKDPEVVSSYEGMED